MTAIIRDLDDAVAEALLYDWPLWARAEQLPPPGDWFCWLILAGRGWGKTRTGAEWVRWRVEQCGARRVALIGQTVADVRDVIVEGESGVLAVHPRHSRPHYEPSKRRLTWPNGAVATTYSGDEPDQLRGPQHDTVWCLVGETPVLMGDGSQKRIADIRDGDYVQTRQGPKRVTAQALTKQKTQVYLLHTMDGRGILGTGDHPVWVIGKGFTPLSTISKGESICATPVSNGMVGSGTSTAMAITIPSFACIARSGKRRMVQFRKGAISIIKTAISRTTDSKTSNCSHTANIARSTTVRSSRHIQSGHIAIRSPHESATGALAWNARLLVLSAAMTTIAAQRIQVAIARLNVLKPPDRGHFRVSSENASIAARNTMQRSERNATAQDDVMRGQARRGRWLWSLARFIARSVARCLNRSEQTRASVADRAPSLSTVTVASVERLATPHDVYDITVEDAREFFANGILVHNCDELAKWRYAQLAWDNMEMGLRLGDNPQAVVTTTPRPIPLILALRDDPATVRPTRNLSTALNRANVSERFVTRVIKKYAGTRLGRQELDAEILDDTPGALWTRSGIETTRITRAPALTRIVVGVDPSSGGPDGETGIIGCGKDAAEHGYVLADLTESGDPAVWGPAVIRAFITLKADLVVAEQNQGGAMVAHVIRQSTVEIDGITYRGANLPIELVWASRGKHTRAEPISVLWSQQPPRGHYVGAFPELEDQCCAWVPGETSPDRMDAKVWAMTALFPNEDEPDAAPPAVGGQRPYQGYRPQGVKR